MQLKIFRTKKLFLLLLHHPQLPCHTLPMSTSGTPPLTLDRRQQDSSVPRSDLNEGPFQGGSPALAEVTHNALLMAPSAATCRPGRQATTSNRSSTALPGNAVPPSLRCLARLKKKKKTAVAVSPTTPSPPQTYLPPIVGQHIQSVHPHRCRTTYPIGRTRQPSLG